MGNTITLRVGKPLATWLQEKSVRTGIPQSQLIREQLEALKASDAGAKKFMRLAGRIKGGARDLSTRKGFTKS